MDSSSELVPLSLKSGVRRLATFHDAILWHGLLVIGSESAYLINICTEAVFRHRLGSYFGHAYAHEEVLLIASGERLLQRSEIEFSS